MLRPDSPQPAARRLELALREVLPERPVVGLIANGKPLAAELLQAVADEVRRRLGRDLELTLIKKPSAAYPVSAVQADGMAARAHFVITGVGD